MEEEEDGEPRGCCCCATALPLASRSRTPAALSVGERTCFFLVATTFSIVGISMSLPSSRTMETDGEGMMH